MKERAFRADAREAKGLHDGSITCVVRPVPEFQLPQETDSEIPDHRWMSVAQHDRRYGFSVFGPTEDDCMRELSQFGLSPFGDLGERIWIQESFGWIGHVDSGNPPIREVTDPMDRRRDVLDYAECPEFVWAGPSGYPEEDTQGRQRSSWRSSTQMPRWASRTVLDVKAVKVKRIRAITNIEALRIGIENGCTEPASGCSCNADKLRSLFPEAFDANAWLWLATVAKVEAERKTGNSG